VQIRLPGWGGATHDPVMRRAYPQLRRANSRPGLPFRRQAASWVSFNEGRYPALLKALVGYTGVMTLLQKNRLKLQVNERVSRKDSCERGTVVEVTPYTVKVAWDGGRTSYFAISKRSNIRVIAAKDGLSS
jgi:hypothetical protein